MSVNIAEALSEPVRVTYRGVTESTLIKKNLRFFSRLLLEIKKQKMCHTDEEAVKC